MGKSYEIESKKMVRDFATHQFTLVWILEIIRMIVGDGASVLEGIQKCVSAKVGDAIFLKGNDQYEYQLSEILPIFTIRNNYKTNGNYYYQITDSEITFQYHLKNVGPRMEMLWAEITKITGKNSVEITAPKFDVFALLLDAAREIQSMGLLK